MKYINKFASLISSLQGNKALKKVEKLREMGEIQTEEEYNKKLEELLSKIPQGNFTPTFEYQPFTPGPSSSEQFNDMIDAISDDLEVAFLELNNIYTIIKAHSDVFKDKVIEEIYASVQELVNEIDKLELVANADNSFDNAFVNSFSGDAFSLQRIDQYANELLYDARLDKYILDQNNISIDTQEESVSLPLLIQTDIPFAEASVVNTKTTGSDFNVQLEDSDIQSILVSGSDTNWAYNILKEKEIKTGAVLGIELNLGDKRIINSLDIHPVSDFPSFLKQIEYQNVNGDFVALPDTTLFNRTIDKPVKVSFDDIIARKLRFEFSQSSSTLFSYDQNQPSITFDDLRRNTSLSANAATLSSHIESGIQDPDMLSVLPITTSPTPDFRVLYQYIFALKSIGTGLSSYRDIGYFVSKAYSQVTPGLIGLETTEIIPEYYDEAAGRTVRTGYIEYDIVKKDYNGRGDLIRSGNFPILPTGDLEVKNERMHFGATKKVVPLRFLGHSSLGNGSGVKIYRNNIELLIGTDWRFVDRANALDDTDINLRAGLSSTRIEILHSDDVIRNGIYTSGYTPRHIAEPTVVTSPTDGVDYISNNITEHEIEVGIDRVERSDIFLKIIIRNNSFFTNKTPKLDSYKLLTSAVDPNKYVRI